MGGQAAEDGAAMAVEGQGADENKVHELKEVRDKNAEKLPVKLSELKNCRVPQPRAGPSRAEEQLLLELQQVEIKAQLWAAEEAQHRSTLQQGLEGQQTTVAGLGVQSCVMKGQLAQMQDSLQRLREENTNIVTTLSSEQLRNQELTLKLGQLQEDILELKAVVVLKSQEAQVLQLQRDQLLGTLYQGTEAWLQLASEKQALQWQFSQLVMQLQEKHEQENKAMQNIFQDLRKTQEVVQSSRLQKQQSAPGRDLALPREGDVEERNTKSPQTNSTTPEAVGSSEAEALQDKAVIEESVQELPCQGLLLCGDSSTAAEHPDICPKQGPVLKKRNYEEEDTQKEEVDEPMEEEEEQENQEEEEKYEQVEEEEEEDEVVEEEESCKQEEEDQGVEEEDEQVEEQEEAEEKEEEQEEEMEAEDQQQEEEEHIHQLFPVKGEEKEVVLILKTDCRSCQDEFKGTAQSRGEEPTVGSPPTKHAAASDEECSPGRDGQEQAWQGAHTQCLLLSPQTSCRGKPCTH
ncbi:golgin subfamily A member 2-like [Cavia porcellus]|uniref:golgin subfamily A member 2-like n=1 Tax=Cavia porcellus TaxID=10141 RepID=UPI002FE400B4